MFRVISTLRATVDQSSTVGLSSLKFDLDSCAPPQYRPTNVATSALIVSTSARVTGGKPSTLITTAVVVRCNFVKSPCRHVQRRVITCGTAA